ncbi:hypothetical protein MES5069_520100 [Mesorhizobium escarrei]|uniref:Uncharacterized protein n=1 Tax=Mesorhizobium escarrei TaxID=666018 RepID=A0ABN8K7X7_9HYPH|nr:hypothetical protein MES5069_520100 [Mesorhizobium escarrei]
MRVNWFPYYRNPIPQVVVDGIDGFLCYEQVNPTSWRRTGILAALSNLFGVTPIA